MSYPRSYRAGGRLRWAGLFGLIAALSFCLLPGVADAKKKKNKTVNVASYNLYLGSDLADATNAGLASRTDLFADEVGEVLSEVNANDFAVRAKTIAAEIKKQKVDVAGLQEAALWKLEFPTDGGGPPRGTPALVPLIDYIDTLLNELNKKAKTKKQCANAKKKAKAQGKKPKECFRGYYLVGSQQEADVEQLGDFDHDAGPNGTTCDLSSGTCPNPYPSGGGGGGSNSWLSGNDDVPGVNLGEPPPAQCADGIDNDGDNLIDWGPVPGTNETSGPSPGFFGGNPAPPGLPGWHCNTRLDNSESGIAAFPLGPPLGLPQDANMDNHVYTGDPGTVPDALGNGLDAPGVTDCPDTNPEAGPAAGTDPDGGGGPAPPWDAAGFNSDIDPVSPGVQTPVCLFHGIDGDIRLQMRDVIIARKGGVKTSNVTSGNYAAPNTFKVTVFGVPLNFTRGWVAADVNVGGKKFHLLNTHLESESVGSVREDQAQELVSNVFGPGAALHANTVLVGDLNSDPNREPTNLPNGDGGSNIAINRILAAGYRPVQAAGNSGGHGELLNDLSNTLDNGRIDHILTNSPGITFRSGLVMDPIGSGLWASDHGGVLSRLAVPGGKKKNKKK